MEIPGIGEKMVDKIYQAVNRFYEGGEAAVASEVAEGESEEEAPQEEAAASAVPGEVAPADGAAQETPEDQAVAAEENVVEGQQSSQDSGADAPRQTSKEEKSETNS